MSKTPRQQLGAWMRQRIADMDEVNLPDLARQAVAAHKGDAAFLAAWFEDTAYPVAYTIGTQICAETRVPTIDEEAAPAAQTERKPRGGWFSRMEHAGANYLRLGDMTRADLLTMAEEREGQALTELRMVGLARKLAAQMADDGKRVREVFSEEAIDRWDRLLEIKWTAKVAARAKLATTASDKKDEEAA
jgi:hypothetical protein